MWFKLKSKEKLAVVVKHNIPVMSIKMYTTLRLYYIRKIIKLFFWLLNYSKIISFNKNLKF